MTSKNEITWWFITQIDRDFITGMYGEGYRLYRNNSISYDIISNTNLKDDKLTVTTNTNEQIVLNTEPNIEKFNELLHVPWKKWDKMNGSHPYYVDDRTDYEPWIIKTMKEFGEICL